MTKLRFVLFDEAMAGVKPTLTAEIADHLRSLNAEGVAICLMEHDMRAYCLLPTSADLGRAPNSLGPYNPTGRDGLAVLLGACELDSLLPLRNARWHRRPKL